MTLSRARDPFAGINHWKRKHIPAATQICQHPTAGESSRQGRGEWRRGATKRQGRHRRGTEKERKTGALSGRRTPARERSAGAGEERQRESESDRRERVNKREIMTRPRTGGPLCESRPAYVPSPTRAHRSRAGARGRRVSWSESQGEEGAGGGERAGRGTERKRRQRGVLAWMTRHCRGARVPRTLRRRAGPCAHAPNTRVRRPSRRQRWHRPRRADLYISAVVRVHRSQ